MQGLDFNAAIANAKKNDWINIEKTDTGSKVSLNQDVVPNIQPPRLTDERIIEIIGNLSNKLSEKNISSHDFSLDLTYRRISQESVISLMGRPDFIIQHEEKTKTVSLSETGKNIDLGKLDSGAIDVRLTYLMYMPQESIH